MYCHLSLMPLFILQIPKCIFLIWHELPNNVVVFAMFRTDCECDQEVEPNLAKRRMDRTCTEELRSGAECREGWATRVGPEPATEVTRSTTRITSTPPPSNLPPRPPLRPPPITDITTIPLPPPLPTTTTPRPPPPRLPPRLPPRMVPAPILPSSQVSTNSS